MFILNALNYAHSSWIVAVWDLYVGKSQVGRKQNCIFLHKRNGIIHSILDIRTIVFHILRSLGCARPVWILNAHSECIHQGLYVAGDVTYICMLVGCRIVRDFGGSRHGLCFVLIVVVFRRLRIRRTPRPHDDLIAMISTAMWFLF